MNEMYVLDSDENVILSDPRLSFYFDNKRVGCAHAGYLSRNWSPMWI